MRPLPSHDIPMKLLTKISFRPSSNKQWTRESDLCTQHNKIFHEFQPKAKGKLIYENCRAKQWEHFDRKLLCFLPFPVAFSEAISRAFPLKTRDRRAEKSFASWILSHTQRLFWFLLSWRNAICKFCNENFSRPQSFLGESSKLKALRKKIFEELCKLFTLISWFIEVNFGQLLVFLQSQSLHYLMFVILLPHENVCHIFSIFSIFISCQPWYRSCLVNEH